MIPPRSSSASSTYAKFAISRILPLTHLHLHDPPVPTVQLRGKAIPCASADSRMDWPDLTTNCRPEGSAVTVCVLPPNRFLRKPMSLNTQDSRLDSNDKLQYRTHVYDILNLY